MQYRGLIFVGILGVAACGADRVVPASTMLGTVREALDDDPAKWNGATLATKTLVLTFDDGPGAVEVTGDLSTWLAGRTTPIKATFFVDGACIAAVPATLTGNASCTSPTTGATAVLDQLVSDGHTIGNHTTTARPLPTIPKGEIVTEVLTTDAFVSPRMPWNRLFFRAPSAAFDATVDATLKASAMKKYFGPVSWDVGGGPTDQTVAMTKAADDECWTLGFTTKACGDRYLTEIRAKTKGIVRLHDRSGTTSNHVVDSGIGNTVDLVKYIVPILEGEGYTFAPLDTVPAIAAALPICSTTCTTCTGPTTDDCTTCGAEMWLSSKGACATCSECGAGSHFVSACTTTSDTECELCTVGSFSNVGAIACTLCPEGTFTTFAGAIGCGECGSCNDDDACTKDVCAPTAGCVHETIAGCARTPPPPSSPAGPIDDDTNIPVSQANDADTSACDLGRPPPRGSNATVLGVLAAVELVRRRRRRAGSAEGSPEGD